MAGKGWQTHSVSLLESMNMVPRENEPENYLRKFLSDRVLFLLAVESVGTAHREIVTVGQDLGWSFGLTLTPLVTYHVRDWVWIQRSIIVPEICFLFLAWFVEV